MARNFKSEKKKKQQQHFSHYQNFQYHVIQSHKKLQN